jgi:PIN domain nuclease of toxin-antitoxin system
MKYLLDTHAFLWAAFEPAKLSKRAAEACKTGELWLSVASVWEIVIKVQIGRLTIPEPVRDFVGRQLKSGQIAVLPIHARHAYRAGDLPMYHRDPFDRMLAAQSLEEGLPLISRDPLFAPYAVERIW